MIGQKLHDLIDILSISQVKLLDFKCDLSSDKRLKILRIIIHQKGLSIESLNDLLDKEVRKTWKDTDEKEHNLKIRRLANFFVDQIEKIILESFLDRNSSAKNVMLANAVEKSGNLNLLSRYYDKAYSKAVEEEEPFYQMIGLRGKIRMRYASQSDKDWETALELNEEFIKVLKYTNDQKLAEYYNNFANIYLEKNEVVKDRKQEVNDSIQSFLKEVKDPVHKVWLYFSLAKLNYDDSVRDTYFEKAKSLLSELEEKNNAYYELERRIRFLELRISFFSGKPIDNLMKLSKEIIASSAGFSIINNNTLFYYILFHVLIDQIDQAEKMLEENHLYFKGTGVLMENFLKAVIFENKGDYKKAIQLLNPIMYTDQYFFAVFSRLVLIKIHLKRENRTLCKSLISSTYKFLLQNSGTPLGKEANEYVLQVLKKKVEKRGLLQKQKEKIVLSVFHEYLLNS